MCIDWAGRATHTLNARRLFFSITPLLASLSLSGCEVASAGEPVEPPSLRSVAAVVVSPSAVALDSGTSRLLLASALDADGLVMGNVGITWESLDPTTAMVNVDGLLTANRTGAAKVRAVADNRSDTVEVTVTAPAPTEPPVAATVIFSDDFESGSLGSWHDGVNAAKHRIVTDASRAADGSRFLEILYPASSDGGWLTRFFMPGYDSIRVSYDVQFESSWTGGTKLLNVRGSRSDNQWSSFGQAGKCPDGQQWFATNVVMLANEHPGPIRFYTYYPGMPLENDGVSCWGRHSGMGTTTYSGTSTIARGVWHRVEMFVKLNTPGQSNGVQRLWVDGQLRGEWTGLALRNTSMLRLNSITLEASQMGGPVGTTRRLFVDNVRVTR
jgi:hypothetical protein